MGIRLQDVNLVHRGGIRALHGVGFGAAAGEAVAVIGPSGAGKTSLLRVLATSVRPDAGSVGILGREPWSLPRRELRRLRSRIGMVHQAPPLPARQRVVTAVLAGRLGQWPLWRALASLLYPLDIAGARAALARLDVADKLFERCDRLSGGQLQRVGIARVFYQRPQLLLADEPVSALDPASAHAAVGELVAESRRSGATLVASLHAVDLALQWFPRVIGLKHGQVLFDLPASQVTRELLVRLYGAIPGEPSASPEAEDVALHPAAFGTPRSVCY